MDLPPAPPTRDRAPSAATGRWGLLLAALGPAALAILAYARALRGELLFDDVPGIVENPAARSLAAWLDGLRDPFALLLARPLTTLTFVGNHAAGGLAPLGYHAVNLALHLAAVALAGALAARLAALAGAARPRRIGIGVAGLFAVHPLQSEAVSYVSQRSEVLASVLYLATLLLLLRAERAEGRRLRALHGAALATFALGLAAKPILLSLPVAWLVLRASAAPRAASPAVPIEGARALRRIAPFAVLAVLAAALVLAGLRGDPGAGFSVAGAGPWSYLLTEAQAILVYLRLLAWPAGQSADWGFPPSPGLGDPATLAAGIAVIGLALAAAALLVRGRRGPGPGGATARLAGAGLAFWLVLLSVTSSVVPLADPLAEHRTYLASFGILLATVAAGDALAARLGRERAAVAAWAAVVLALAVALHRRNAVWESSEALFADAVARNPHAARARLGLAEALLARGRTGEAIREYELAREDVGPNLAQRARILLGLGEAQLDAGRLDDARRTLEEGLHFTPKDDRLLVALANVAGATGDADRADTLARSALAWNPRAAGAWAVLGNLALERGDLDGALGAYGRALAIDPGRGEAHYGRALALRALGRGAEECAAMRSALGARLGPGWRERIGEELRARCAVPAPGPSGATGAVPPAVR